MSVVPKIILWGCLLHSTTMTEHLCPHCGTRELSTPVIVQSLQWNGCSCSVKWWRLESPMEVIAYHTLKVWAHLWDHTWRAGWRWWWVPLCLAKWRPFCGNWREMSPSLKRSACIKSWTLNSRALCTQHFEFTYKANSSYASLSWEHHLIPHSRINYLTNPKHLVPTSMHTPALQFIAPRWPGSTSLEIILCLVIS